MADGGQVAVVDRAAAVAAMRELVALSRAAGRELHADVDAWVADPKTHRDAIKAFSSRADMMAEFGGGPCPYVATALWHLSLGNAAGVEEQLARFRKFVPIDPFVATAVLVADPVAELAQALREIDRLKDELHDVRGELADAQRAVRS